ncbi:ABC-type nitrate/sulfonate/bicarbonate transport system, ATPase component [Klebsiella pneumoniae IS53]|nr:ABC-type nitrate/sulfonate/bicarbonate transport system, ATPase component [Klebsiella pneumoniae IS53]
MPWSSVRNNVRLPLDLAGVPRAEGNTRVSEVLELVGLGKFADVLPRELSGGMQMRVSIARGLVTRPKLLLMDEPSARWMKLRVTNSTATCCVSGRSKT